MFRPPTLSGTLSARPSVVPPARLSAPPSTTRAARPTTPAPAAASPPLDRALSYRLHRLHLLHKLTDQDSVQACPLQADLSMSDGRCLDRIGSFEPLSVNDLAQWAKLDKRQASRARPR